MSEKWYKKTPPTMSGKLRQVIIDALPFDLNQKQADVILRTIFNTIVEGVTRDGFVTIEGLGRFYKKFTPGRMQTVNMHGRQFKPRKYWIPPREQLAFYANRSLRNSLRDNGDSGTN